MKLQFLMLLILFFNIHFASGQAIYKNEITIGPRASFGAEFTLKEFGDKQPFIGANVLYGLKDNIGLNFDIGYSVSQSTKYKIHNSIYRLENDNFSASAMISYHFFINDNSNIDCYLGVGSMFVKTIRDINKDESLDEFSPTYSDIDKSSFIYGLGVRYWLTNSLNINLQITKGYYLTALGLNLQIN